MSRNQLNIKTNRLSEVGKIIDLAIRAGANQVQALNSIWKIRANYNY